MASYRLEVDDSNGQNTFYVSNIPPTGTSDIVTNQYVIHYEGFNDSDATNNYISIYTKSSTAWPSTQNDGKIKQGKNTWRVIAYDYAGNSTSGSGTIYVDYTKPTLSNIGVRDSWGGYQGYTIVTNTNPTVTGKITDNVAAASIQYSIYKENYLLGILVNNNLAQSGNKDLNNSQNISGSLFFELNLSYLDYGKYQVYITGIDKAGNKSTESKVSLLITTPDKAKELLGAPGTPDDSLANLEKQALLRRQIEAFNLEKLIADIANFIKNSSGGLYTEIEPYLASILDFSSQIALQIVDFRNQFAQLAQSFDYSLTAYVQTAAQYIASNLPNPFRPVILALNGFNQWMNSLYLDYQRELALRFEQNYLNNNQENKLLAFLDQLFIYSMGFFERANQFIAQSNQKVREQIALAYLDSSQTLSRGQKALVLTFESLIKPVNQTSDFLSRVVVGIDTFKVIVFDQEPLKISQVTIEEIGPDYAVISWRTNHYATGKVNFGPDLKYGHEVFLDKFENLHVAKLTGLKSGERYFFEVMSQNQSYAYDAYYSFETVKESQ